MENNPDGHLLNKFGLFVLVCRIQPSYYFVESVQKKQERPETYFFAFITNFSWILSTLTKLLRYPVTDFRWNKSAPSRYDVQLHQTKQAIPLPGPNSSQKRI